MQRRNASIGGDRNTTSSGNVRTLDAAREVEAQSARSVAGARRSSVASMSATVRAGFDRPGAVDVIDPTSTPGDGTDDLEQSVDRQVMTEIARVRRASIASLGWGVSTKRSMRLKLGPEDSRDLVESQPRWRGTAAR